MSLPVLFFAFLVAARYPAAGQATPDTKAPAARPAPAPEIPVIRLMVRPVANPPRPLRYLLLPDPLDLTPGNAAPQWTRAGVAAAHVKRKLTGAESDWLGKTPLNELPVAEVRKFLEEYRQPLGVADQAARMERCDWEQPPLTIPAVMDLSLHEVQELRELVNLLALRFRLELREGHLDKALYTLQTGFAMGRHAAQGNTVIQGLVGVAVATVMFGRLEEFLQAPGAPNLFWALSALPEPLVDVRPAILHEMGTLYRTSPQLRRLERDTLSEAEVSAIVQDLFNQLSRVGRTSPELGWMERLGQGVLVVQHYAEARKFLLARGRTAEQVDALPKLQVVFLMFLDRYDRERDDMLKWLNLPPWQARVGLEQVEKQAKGPPDKQADILTVLGRLLMPALARVYHSQVRTQRYLAGLRCAEAVRLHAASDGGKLPARLTDVRDLPMPTDPATGKGFDEYYKVEGDRAVLEIPPLPGQPATTGRRYEIRAAK